MIDRKQYAPDKAKNDAYNAAMAELRNRDTCPLCGSVVWWRHSIPIYHYCGDCHTGFFCNEQKTLNQIYPYIEGKIPMEYLPVGYSYVAPQSTFRMDALADDTADDLPVVRRKMKTVSPKQLTLFEMGE